MLFEKLEYQQQCVDNIVRALAGCDFAASDFSLLTENLRDLDVPFPSESKPRKNQIDVLMETGTGKTFTYLKTIFELHRLFGQSKFIIVLPRVAIKLGVIQNIQLTKEYFYNEYQRHLDFINYPKDGLACIHNDFINSNRLSVIITTNSAFNSKDRRINKQDENLLGMRSTWDGIACEKPVVIIDEPHLLKGSETKRGLAKLGKSLFIRFGATFPADSENSIANLAYALDSKAAFDRRLVKKIGVSTVFDANEMSNIEVKNIVPRTSFEAVYQESGLPRRTIIRKNDDIGAKTKLKDYSNVSVTKINASGVVLSDGRRLEPAKAGYNLSDHQIRSLLEHSVEHHFQKEEHLFARGIKALSLFFIPNVSDYRDQEGKKTKIKNMFVDIYLAARKRCYEATGNGGYKAYLDRDYDDDGLLRVHEGYFAGDRGNLEKREEDGVNQILNNKEALLSFASPLRFIFSVWALQEGWDNPNIFTICKLASTGQEISKRQQVGRGLRIAVNQAGRRLTHSYFDGDDDDFHDVNKLDVVVSGAEKDFIFGIQKEIQKASQTLAGETLTFEMLVSKGFSQFDSAKIMNKLYEARVVSMETNRVMSPVATFIKSHPDCLRLSNPQDFAKLLRLLSGEHVEAAENNDPSKETKVRILKENWDEFQETWEAINTKARVVYRGIDDDSLGSAIVEEFAGKASEFPFEETVYVDHEYDSTTDRVMETYRKTTADHNPYFIQNPISDYIVGFARENALPLRFVAELFAKLDLDPIKRNPSEANALLTKAIKDETHARVIKNVSYEFTETSIYPNSLQDSCGTSKTSLKSTHLGLFLDSNREPSDGYLYDTVVYDSEIEKASICSDSLLLDDHQITVFAKLPKINIPTPYRTYNPDFAYLIENKFGNRLILVVETKGYRSMDDVSEEERKKIDYGQKFFEALNKAFPEANIHFETRINNQDLASLISKCLRVKR